MTGQRELSGEALVRDLERRFVTVESEVRIGGATYAMLRPRSAEDLIDETEFERDERLPYWADVWPSSLALASKVRAERGEGRPLLELGCGVGVVALAATLAGFDVTPTDYYHDAVRFARANVWRHTGHDLAGRHVDWRAMPRNLGVHDRVVASDVLYERPYAELVARAIAVTLARRGTAYVADPGRLAAPDFVQSALHLGFAVDDAETHTFESGRIRQTIRIYALTRPGS